MNKVLIIDDEIVNRKLTTSYLLELGYKESDLVEFSNGKEAIDGILKMENEQIDYILLDIYMPEINGIGVIEFLKSNDKFKNIPIIIMTTDDKLKFEVGKMVDSFLVRPVKFNDFVKTISQYVKED